MRTIDADALIADLEYDVELDARALDSMDSVGRDWETIWFDKNCKQNAIDLLQHAPTIEPERKTGQWIKAIDEQGGAWSCSECTTEYIVDKMDEFPRWAKYCPECGANMKGGKNEVKGKNKI